MKIVGFNFTKMSAERLKSSSDKLTIKTSLDFPEVKEVKTQFMKTSEPMIEAQFSYRVDYEPSLAKIVIEGNVLIAVDEKTHEDILKQWKKKALPEEFKFSLFNMVMKKAALKALRFCDELNLPVHIPLPSVQKEKK